MNNNLTIASRYYFTEIINTNKYLTHLSELLLIDYSKSLKNNGAIRIGTSLKNAIVAHAKFLMKQDMSYSERQHYDYLLKDSSVKKILDKVTIGSDGQPDFIKIIQDDNLLGIMIMLKNFEDEQTSELNYIISSSIVNLCTAIEQLLSEVIKHLLMKNPKSASLEKKQLTFEKIQELKDIDSINEYLINKKVNELMFENNNKWFNYLNKTFKLDFSKIDNLYFDEINELIQRRHIIVHNNSIVDEKYIKNVKITNTKIGCEIINTPKYIMEKLKTLSIFGAMFLDIITAKFPQDDNNYLYPAVNLSKYYYNSQDYFTAEKTLRTVINNKHLSSLNNDDKEDTLIQYWAIKKLLNDYSDIENDIIDYAPNKTKNKIYKFFIMEKYDKIEGEFLDFIKKELAFFYELENNPLLKVAFTKSDYIKHELVQLAEKVYKAFNHKGYIYSEYIKS